VRVGQVFINGYGAGCGIELPFGGMKKSGHGREKGSEALYELSTNTGKSLQRSRQPFA
jgi:aldehyde dehydrogenase (NAD+)